MNRNLRKWWNKYYFHMDGLIYIFSLKQKFDENFWFEYQKENLKNDTTFRHLEFSLFQINKILV